MSGQGQFKRVLCVSSSRADVGIQAPVWSALAERGANLAIFATGSHCRDDAAEVRDAVGADGTVHVAGAELGGNDAPTASRAMAAIGAAAGDALAKFMPEILLVTGDRLDMVPAAMAALPFRIPVAHLHGGELSEGAIDDRIRHAITKISHLHFVSSESAARRVAELAEEPWRILVTGAPGLDTLCKAPLLDRETFLREAGAENLSGDTNALRLVTVHPETNAADPALVLDIVLGALDTDPQPTLFTAANEDPGGMAMNETIRTFVANRPWTVFRPTLGPRLYASALRHAAVMIGNSSSGIIEAGLFGLSVINIGSRQDRRDRGANVTDVPAEPEPVLRALRSLGPRPARFPAGTPYGDGASGRRVAALLTSPPNLHCLFQKRFHAAT